MSLLAIIYLISIYTLPALEPLNTDFFAWMLFGIYILLLFFVWGSSSKHYYEEMSEDNNKKLNDTKDILKEKSRWY